MASFATVFLLVLSLAASPLAEADPSEDEGATCHDLVKAAEGRSDFELAAICRSRFPEGTCRTAWRDLGPRPWAPDVVEASCASWQPALQNLGSPRDLKNVVRMLHKQHGFNLADLLPHKPHKKATSLESTTTTKTTTTTDFGTPPMGLTGVDLGASLDSTTSAKPTTTSAKPTTTYGDAVPTRAAPGNSQGVGRQQAAATTKEDPRILHKGKDHENEHENKATTIKPKAWPVNKLVLEHEHGFTSKWEDTVTHRHVSRTTVGGHWLSLMLASAAVVAAGALIVRGVRRVARRELGGGGAALMPSSAEVEAAEEQQFLLGLE